MSDCNVLVATAELRWVHRSVDQHCWTLILQQYFTDPLNVSGKGEWRDIPIVNENSTEPPILEN